MTNPAMPPADAGGMADTDDLTGADGWRRLGEAASQYFRSPVNVLAALVVLSTLLAAIAASWIAPFEPNLAVPKDRLLGFGEEGHLFGTDLIGRDVFSRLLHGARLAWIVGVTVSVIALLIGGTIGAVSGYFGGWFDSLASRIIDGILSFPPVLLALVLAAIYSPSTASAVVALAIVFSPLAARVIRSVVLAERQLDYVSAARGLGHRELWTLVRHILPNTIGPMAVVATIIVSRSIIVESSLSFIGAGTQPPNASWGLMVAEAQEVLRTEQQLIIVPALVLVVTVLAINLTADALADYLDPTGRVQNTRTRKSA